jgi:hypothetical protein
MAFRRPIPIEVETRVLTTSARRCALCYGLDGKLAQVQGQIAHIDRDASNPDEKNLAFLCLPHHDAYDTRTSQSKGHTPLELTAYKQSLLAAIEAGMHISSAATRPVGSSDDRLIRDHDVGIFQVLNARLPEDLLIDLLGRLQSDDSFDSQQMGLLQEFRSESTKESNRFIDEMLVRKLSALVETVTGLTQFMAKHFFVYPEGQSDIESLRYCLYPELNIDRAGRGRPGDLAEYETHQQALDSQVESVRIAYSEYRASIKSQLRY